MRAIFMSCNNCNKDYAFEGIGEYIKPEMKVLCVPFASDLHWQLQGDYTEYKQQHFKVFNSFGINDDNIDILSIHDDMDTIIDKVLGSDIIFFSGGYMENAMYLLDKMKFNLLLPFIKKDKLVMGESAGALILQDIYYEVPHIEDAYKQYREKQGLGLISDYNIIVHYDENNPKHKENAKHVKNLNDRITICLSDESIFIVDDNCIRFIGQHKMM